MKRASRQAWLAAASALLCAVLVPPLLAALAVAARAGAAAPRSGRPAAVRHVVIVGISGLTWDLVTPAAMPELWRLANAGSVGSLVDYAQQPLACPADGWLTLNSGARAQGPRPCTPLPAVASDGPRASIPSMPQIIMDNQQYHESPDWGLLGSLAGCATAVGPGAALALAAPAGTVSSYLASADQLSPVVLARCPLTVIDLGQISGTERSPASTLDSQLAHIAASLPVSTLLLVMAPGAAVTGSGGVAGAPHLMTVVVSGPGFGGGVLDSAATRRPGIVTLTDLTPTVAGWLGRALPAGTVGARIVRRDRSGDLAATVSALTGRDNAEQVWLSTHDWFFAGYALAGVLAFGLPALLFPGGDEERRRRRGRCWRIAGALAAAVPLGSYLANLAPWWRLAYPAWWLYGLTAVCTVAVAAVALAGPWRRDPLGPFGAVCLATLGVLAVDVMTGSRLQLEAPFGLSLLVSGRYYGIGNDALGVYCVSTLTAAAWLGMLASRVAPPSPVEAGPRVISSLPALAAAALGLFAVVAAGWPGFGAKVGATIALVPCLVLLIVWLAGTEVRIGWRWAVPIALSGAALVAAFAMISYFFPAAGVSDMGTFAGNLLHGQAGDLLQRKAGSNVGSLTDSLFGWLIPLAAVAAAVALWRPSALRLRTLTRAFESVPLVRVLARLSWLVLVIGWLADDSGVVVPAAALPFAVPLTIAIAASVSIAADRARYFGSVFAGPSVAGTPRGNHLPR